MAAAIAAACSISCATGAVFTDNRRLDYAKLFIGSSASVEKRGYVVNPAAARLITPNRGPLAPTWWEGFGGLRLGFWTTLSRCIERSRLLPDPDQALRG
jgi:hypothetical protein